MLTVIGRNHRNYLTEADDSALPGQIVAEPQVRDSGPAIFLAAAHVLSRDPLATLLILPSDHFVFPEDRFVRHVKRAGLLAEQFPHRLVVLGALPYRAEEDYGWIEPGAEVLWSWATGSPARPVKAFWEKPTPAEARCFFDRGYLWNTMVVAVKVGTLWDMGRAFVPDLIERFDAYRSAIGTPHEDAALIQTYSSLQPQSFSHVILEQIPESAIVLPVEDVEWSDWGRPERIVESLARIGEKPSFPVEYLEEQCAGSRFS